MAMIQYTTWGKGKIPGDGFAIPREDETPIQAVCRSIERRMGLTVCAGPRDEGTRLDRDVPIAHHYFVTLGRPLRTGGYLPETEVWISIPV